MTTTRKIKKDFISIPVISSTWDLCHSSYRNDVYYWRYIKDFWGGKALLIEHPSREVCKKLLQNIRFLVKLHAKDKLYIRRPIVSFDEEYGWFTYELELWIKDEEDFSILANVISKEIENWEKELG